MHPATPAVATPAGRPTRYMREWRAADGRRRRARQRQAAAQAGDAKQSIWGRRAEPDS